MGVITLRKITESLWGIWHIFVSPSSRGKRIASLLYQESFRLLKSRRVSKAVGMVFLDNVPSMKSVQRDWQGFLSARIFACETQIAEVKLPSDIRVRKPHVEKEKLFEVYKNCVGEQWCRILEVDEDNFLDRIYGPGYFEPVSKNLLTRFLMRNDVIVTEHKGEIEGYAICREIRFSHSYHNLHLFVPASGNFDGFSRGLLTSAHNALKHSRKDNFTFACVGHEDLENRLRTIGFKVRQGVVPYKYL